MYVWIFFPSQYNTIQTLHIYQKKCNIVHVLWYCETGMLWNFQIGSAPTVGPTWAGLPFVWQPVWKTWSLCNPMISTEFKSPATHHMTSIPFYVDISGTTSHESNDSGTHQSLKCFLWDVLHVNFLLQHFPRQGVSLPWYMYFWVIYSFTFSIKLLFIKLSLCPR